ncbi:energy transducer TonB family protein [Aquirhabdus parva]|uniref:Energy transducer TonB n=1 Tax=Aquirhabdus parva TaxID=2283318 RepID=A0A345PA32_9GAMM|nr:energy transducer TonB [Aquirhabdus parva]AXI04141.1 hypothetical protein HYN46_15625 [Aquirhabdus parva]
MKVDFKNPSVQAFGFALLIEVGLIAAVVIYGVNHVSYEHVKSEAMITLTETTPEVKPEVKPEIKPKVEPPKPKPKPLDPPKLVKQKVEPKPVQPTPPKPIPAEEKALPTPVATPTAATEPTPPAPVTPPVVKSDVDPHVVSSYAAKLLAAVQAATHCPDGVQFSGRVRVAFSLSNTDPSSIRILVGSHVTAIDEAARHAVLDARIPEPPAEMKGSLRNYQTWVDLNCQ